MSRTDVHTPDWVKERDPWWRHHFKEDHNHERGPCDLHLYSPSDWRRTHCHIVMRWQGRQIHCGCPMCTEQYARRQQRRKDRREARRLIRNGSWDRLITRGDNRYLTYWGY